MPTVDVVINYAADAVETVFSQGTIRRNNGLRCNVIYQCVINISLTCNHKAKAKDLTLKAKAEDISHEAKDLKKCP